ncbi:hypothetical protein [Actinobacillus pleuropneumoniae]|uniref:hypothetical protein n=1 Tax=Actinobacillus pleuropneumoniae TaxID=715 RepID=UPI0005C58702|nr:hypothetical protein [Actinobacillus pleuropneumoniae]
MKKIIFTLAIVFVIGGCGVSTTEMRSLETKSYLIKSDSQQSKQCLLDKLNDFRPDRMLINDLGERTEIFIGATQAGKFRNFYLFNVSSQEVKLSHYDGIFPALSEREADEYIKSCL